MNGGSCTQKGASVQCQCPSNFAGPRCEWGKSIVRSKSKFSCHAAVASVCSSNTCENGGTCRQVAPTMAECLCPNGFAGPTCHLRKFSDC